MEMKGRDQLKVMEKGRDIPILFLAAHWHRPPYLFHRFPILNFVPRRLGAHRDRIASEVPTMNQLAQPYLRSLSLPSKELSRI